MKEVEPVEVFSRERASSLLSAWIKRADESRHRSPALVSAMLETADMLEPCWLAACRDFGASAQPEHALQILSVVMSLSISRSREEAEQRGKELT
jgi:hypothetical protein